MVSKYIEKSTGLTAKEIEEISLYDWMLRSSKRKRNRYRVKHPRLLRPRGSVYAIFKRFIKTSEIEDYYNMI